MNRIRVFHVEDYKIMRDGILNLLEDDPEIELVGSAGNGPGLIQALESADVDVLIMDLYLDSMENLDTMNGFQICAYLRDTYPHIKVIAHSIYDDADRVSKIVRTGALGFVSKKSGFDELVNAIRTVNQGERYICSETASRLKNLNQFMKGLEVTLKAKEEMFSHRERAVLELLAQGKSSKEIAEELFIAERTVESHRRHMVEKGNVRNTAELIALGASLGILKK
jgi:DNA-binding NarL/FixJ family response regulator